MKNFMTVFEKKLIYDVDGQTVEWAEDFLRCFKDSPPLFVNRPDFASLEDYQKQLLKRLLSSSDLGDIYKLDTVDWRGRRVRGIIAELDHHHSQYKDWDHTPNGHAVDWTKGQSAVQLKSIASATEWVEENLIGAVEKIITWRGQHAGVNQIQLVVKKKPGLVTGGQGGLEEVIRDYILTRSQTGNYPAGLVIELVVNPYTFIPTP
jgi:hypothetical protein